jgi:hypothetical protein
MSSWSNVYSSSLSFRTSVRCCRACFHVSMFLVREGVTKTKTIA